jgi:hypothetical protein
LSCRIFHSGIPSFLALGSGFAGLHFVTVLRFTPHFVTPIGVTHPFNPSRWGFPLSQLFQSFKLWKSSALVTLCVILSSKESMKKIKTKKPSYF